MLRLGGGVNHELSIVRKLLQPSGDVRGLILENRRRESGFGAEIGSSHLRDHLLETVQGEPNGAASVIDLRLSRFAWPVA